MMWSTHSRRIDPISRSAKPFCQGEAGAVEWRLVRQTRVGVFSLTFGPNAFLNETNQTRSLPRWRNQRRQADYVRNRFGFKKFFSAPRRGVPTCMAYLARFDPTAMIENWQQLPDGQIEFTMRRPPAAD